MTAGHGRRDSSHASPNHNHGSSDRASYTAPAAERAGPDRSTVPMADSAQGLGSVDLQAASNLTRMTRVIGPLRQPPGPGRAVQAHAAGSCPGHGPMRSTDSTARGRRGSGGNCRRGKDADSEVIRSTDTEAAGPPASLSGVTIDGNGSPTDRPANRQRPRPRPSHFTTVRPAQGAGRVADTSPGRLRCKFIRLPAGRCGGPRQPSK